MIRRNATFQALLVASRKGGGPVYTRYVNRTLAMPLTLLFWKLGLSPNTISVLSFGITHLALLLLLLLPTTPAVCVTAYLVLVLGFVTDSCDGQLARVTGRSSRLGDWLDHSLDMLKLLNIHMILGYVALQQSMQHELPLTPVFVATFLCLLSQPSLFYVTSFASQVVAHRPATHQPRSGTGGRWLASLIGNGVDYGLFIMIVLLLPWPEIFVPVYLAYGLFLLVVFLATFTRILIRAARQERAGRAPTGDGPPQRDQSGNSAN